MARHWGGVPLDSHEVSSSGSFTVKLELISKRSNDDAVMTGENLGQIGRKLTWQWKITMFLLELHLQMVGLSIVMLVFGGVTSLSDSLR